jgi:energy-coupling factor transporter ATP-binding protein EcfA2
MYDTGKKFFVRKRQPVYISKISLKNIRGFESLDFDLDRGGGKYAGWTVFTGSNGAGKSSLMRAIATCLVGRDTTRALETSFKGWIREPSNNEKSEISLEIVRVPGDESRQGKPSEKPFTARLELKASDPEPILVDTSPKKNKKKAIATDTIWSNSPQRGWFACGYGPFRRVFGASADAQRTMTAPRTNAWVTLFKEEASLLEADKWMRDLNYQALEKKTAKEEERDILLEILRDDFLPGAIKIESHCCPGKIMCGWRKRLSASGIHGIGAGNDLKSPGAKRSLAAGFGGATMRDELWPDGVCATDRLSASQAIPEMRGPLRRRSLREKLLLLGPVSGHGLRASDLSRESARH